MGNKFEAGKTLTFKWFLSEDDMIALTYAPEIVTKIYCGKDGRLFVAHTPASIQKELDEHKR
jgi:hypothetical protein